VTGFVHSNAWPNLPPGAGRIASILEKPKPIAIACLAALTAAGWIALALMAADGGWEALCRPGAVAGWAGLPPIFAMWAAMTLAMMLPTAGPMVLTYAEIADTAARKREAVVSPLLLIAGYILIWLGFAAAAAAVQFAIAQAGQFDPGAPVAGVVLVVAGAYQFSTLKQACLTQCQRPFPFFFANWTAEPRGVVRLGLRQGLLCLGCCWAAMAVMFAVGAMNAVWMAALGALMTVEKMTLTARFSRAVGYGFIAAGLATLAAAFLQTGLPWT
jgi:predicted metal-binding membrane protein